MFKHPRTTALGILGIIVAVASAAIALLDGNSATNVDLAALITQVTTGLALVKAADAANVTG